MLSSMKNIVFIFLLFITVLMFAGSLFLAVSRNSDMDEFRKIIKQEIKSNPGTGAFVEELNEWVYSNKGFAKNTGFYLFRSFGATPKQILEKGGDCSDKSRLLSAMLASVNMNSTLVMIYSCDICQSTHTVLNVRYDKGWMGVDPVFNIVFSKGDELYWGVKDLRDNPSLLTNTLDKLVKKRGYKDKIAFYPRRTESYSVIKTINWDKNGITQMIGGLIGFYTDEPFLVIRPHFLEDPKLFYSYFMAILGGWVLLVLLFFKWSSKK